MVTGLSIGYDGGHITQRPSFFVDRLSNERAGLSRRQRSMTGPAHPQVHQEKNELPRGKPRGI